MARGSMVCQYEQMVGPTWPLSAEMADQIWASLQEPPWFEEPPDRYGFVDLDRYSDSIIMGYFAVEKPLHIVRYDNEKHREEHEEESFEHIWFALFLDLGRLLAQRRRFIHRKLQADQVIQRLRETLALKFASSLTPILEFRPYEKVVEKETFLSEFSRGRVREVRIDSLGGAVVPADVRLFNPDVDKDAILREVLTQDNLHIDRLTAHATEGGDLEKAKVVRGEMAAGEPHYLKREDDEGASIVFQREIRETLYVPADIEETRAALSNEDKDRVVAIVEERPVPKRRRREQPGGQSRLFSEDDDEDEDANDEDDDDDDDRDEEDDDNE